MHVRRVKVTGVRCFEDEEIDLTRPDGSLAGWTVFAGRNGSGKTTLLQAIALGIAGDRAGRALIDDLSSIVRGRQGEASVELSMRHHTGDLFVPGGGDLPITRQTSGEIAMRTANSRDSKCKVRLSVEMVDGLAGSAYVGPWGDTYAGWFVSGYGPFRRLSWQSEDGQRAQRHDLRGAALTNLFRGDAPLVEGLRWLRELKIQEQAKSQHHRPETLATCIAIVNDGLLSDGVQIEAVTIEEVRFRQRGVELLAEELSDGSRTIIALVIDLLMKLDAGFINGLAALGRCVDEHGSPRLLHHGVVLIDEADLHLHVSWQRRLGFWFKKHFPNIQFLVTTHSPFICQAADPGGLFKLPSPGERGIQKVSDDTWKAVVNGSLDEAVLSDLFGLEQTWSDESEKIREEVARLEVRVLRDVATPEETARYHALLAKLPNRALTDIDRVLRRVAQS